MSATPSLAQWRERAQGRLCAVGVSVDEAQEELSRLLEDLGGYTRLAQLTRSDECLSQVALETLERALERRERREPLSHILGVWSFWGLEFFVDARVLTPRPDTEVLVEEALAWLNARLKHQEMEGDQGVKGDQGALTEVIDVCAGSGCVGLALLSERPLKLTLSELSGEAFEVLRRNHTTLLQQGALKGKATLCQGDLLTPLPAHVRPDLIVSNPPYICPTELSELMPEVRDYEPLLALDGGAEGGLELPQRLIEQAYERLTPGGALMIEVGWRQTEEVSARFKAQGFERVWVRRDYGGNPRVVGGVKPLI